MWVLQCGLPATAEFHSNNLQQAVRCHVPKYATHEFPITSVSTKLFKKVFSQLDRPSKIGT